MRQHLFALDVRLNQNYLVGVGVMRHREGETELLYGATVPFWALIPRAIWPDKPAVGGGGDLVSQFTGITFAEGTSVGTGQVLEFYMNFGMPGVLAGFAVLGFILMRLDQRMMRALAMGNIHGLVQCALPGLALLQPLGSLLEIARCGSLRNHCVAASYPLEIIEFVHTEAEDGNVGTDDAGDRAAMTQTASCRDRDGRALSRSRSRAGTECARLCGGFLFLRSEIAGPAFRPSFRLPSIAAAVRPSGSGTGAVRAGRPAVHSRMVAL